MLEEAIKKCSKTAKLRMTIALIIVVAAMVAPMGAPISMILGAKDITHMSDLDYSDYKGKYVSFEAEYVLDYYLETYSVNSDTGSRSLTSYGYVVYNWDDDTCFAMELPSEYDVKVSELINQTVEYYNYGTATTKKVTIKGTLKELTGEELGYYNESIDNLGESLVGISDVAVKYVLVAEQVNGVDEIFVFIAYGVAVIALLVAVYTAIRNAGGASTSKMRKFIEEHPGVTEEQIDSDMGSATKVGNLVWAGRRFTVFIQGYYLHVLDNKNLVWAYYFQQTGRNAVSQVKTFNTDHKMVVINLSQKLSEQLLQAYIDTQPQMIVGYDKELEKQYKKDFAGFLALKYNPAQAAGEDDVFNRFYNMEADNDRYASREEENASYAATEEYTEEHTEE